MRSWRDLYCAAQPSGAVRHQLYPGHQVVGHHEGLVRVPHLLVHVQQGRQTGLRKRKGHKARHFLGRRRCRRCCQQRRSTAASFCLVIEIGASWGTICLSECAWALVTGLAITTATLPAPILILLLPSHCSRQSSQEDSGQANCHVPACVAPILPGLVRPMKNRQKFIYMAMPGSRFQGIHRGFKLTITLIIYPHLHSTAFALVM